MSIRRLLACVCALAALSLTLAAGPASAETQRSANLTFGSDGTPSSFYTYEQRIGFDEQSEDLYVSPVYPGECCPEGGHDGLYKYDMSTPGTAVPYGPPFPIGKALPGQEPTWPCCGNLAVDNTGGSTQGRIYISHSCCFPEPGADVRVWNPDGSELLSSGFPVKAAKPGTFCFPAVDSAGNIAVSSPNAEAMAEGRGVARYTSAGVPLIPIDTKKYQDSGPCYLAYDSEDNLYVSAGASIWKYTASSLYTEATKFIENKGSVGNQMVIDQRNDHLLMIKNDSSGILEYDKDGNLLLEFGEGLEVFNNSFYSLAINENTGEVYVQDQGSNNRVHVYGPPIPLPKVTTDRPDSVTTTGAVLHGHIEIDGAPNIVACYFQFGVETNYLEGEQPCTPGASPGSPITADAAVSAQLSGLASHEATYHYRLVVETAQGTQVGKDQTLITADPPVLAEEKVIEVTADHVLLQGSINPKGVFSTWAIEYGTGDCSVIECQITKPEDLVNCDLLSGCTAVPKVLTPFMKEIINLTPGTLYHFRLVGTNNQGGVGHGTDHTFRTFPLDPAGTDPCPNAHERKLSSGSKLSHCRAYELVSALDAGGYDVASNIVEGESPLDAYPAAEDRFLYTTSVGKLPGVAGFPVNLGTDPYVASRGAGGWSTKYVGLSATTPSAAPFASTMTGADAGLGSFAFSAPDRCSPCFADGSTGIPLRLADGSLIQGMKGSIDVPDPEPAGEVAKPLSADADHFVFGSKQKFEPAGNANALTLYDRDLSGGTTQVVSTMPDGSTMTGEAAELDVSADGSRVLIGRPVGTDSEGNPHYDLYMHVGTNPDSVAVADTPSGVIYNGMSDDGSQVYFSTRDKLLDDTDSSADIFRADVSATSAALTRVSNGSGGTGNSDACAPPDDWNVAEGGPDCSALAFAGGAGVAAGDGTFFFLSPELLDGAGHGVQDQPNLYISRPGAAPKFVALFDDSTIKPPPSPPRRPIVTKKFGGEHSEITGMAVDRSNNDVYVAERERVSRFDAEGSPHLFSAGSGAGTNKIGGIYTAGQTETGIAVDNAPTSLFKGSLYLLDTFYTIDVFAPSGEKLGSFSVPEFACGLAVDQNNGDVYVSEYSGKIRRFHPTSGATPVSAADYTETSISAPSMQPCQIGVDSDPSGYIYVAQYGGGPLRQFAKSDFAAVPPELAGKQIAPVAFSVSVDPITNEIYVEEGKLVSVYDSAGGPPLASVGVGTLVDGSRVVAVNGSNKHTYVDKENQIIDFGFEIVPFLQIDNPPILRAVEQAEVHRSDDFQITPDGNVAIFTTKVQLTSTPSDGNAQVYRYEAPTGKLECVSCTPTGAVTTSDAFLTPNGTNVSDDGRVFFTTPEQLTLRDTNRRTDAYEWDNKSLNLISTGTGVINAALASVDSSGRNAYFFTRESIIPQDDNGPTMKVYTAREAGGYTYLPEGIPCQAADECRGPGTVVPPPPAIGTYKGTGGNLREEPKCKKGQVRRHGRCVKKRKKGAQPKRHKRGAHRG